MPRGTAGETPRIPPLDLPDSVDPCDTAVRVVGALELLVEGMPEEVVAPALSTMDAGDGSECCKADSGKERAVVDSRGRKRRHVLANPPYLGEKIRDDTEAADVC